MLRAVSKGLIYPLQYSGQENSRDYRPWGGKESDTTEKLSPSRYYTYTEPGTKAGREGTAD